MRLCSMKWECRAYRWPDSIKWDNIPNTGTQSHYRPLMHSAGALEHKNK